MKRKGKMLRMTLAIKPSKEKVKEHSLKLKEVKGYIIRSMRVKH